MKLKQERSHLSLLNLPFMLQELQSRRKKIIMMELFFSLAFIIPQILFFNEFYLCLSGISS